MEFLNWLRNNWLPLLQGFGIIGGLFFTGLSLRTDTKVRRIDNLFNVTKQHREIWTYLYSRPELKRVLETNVDLQKQPITREEELFVNLLILHLVSAYRASQQGMIVAPEELRADVVSFFTLPIPRSVWENTRRFQDRDFVQFVENYRTPPFNFSG